MTQQILYFTAGSVPTEAEKTEIAEIEAVTNPFAVRLANGSMPVVNGISPDGPILQEVSFVAGTPPIEYADIPVFDINDVIPPELADTDAIVSNGALTTNLNGTSRQLTASVSGGALTGLQTIATIAAVATAASAPVQNSAGAAIGTGTVTVANRAITNIRLPATVAGVSNGAEITLDGFTYTFTVAAGVITAITSVEVGEP